MLRQGAALREDRNPHRHEVKEGEGTFIATRNDLPRIGGTKHGEIVQPMTEESYGGTHTERGCVHPKIIIE
jgi:hypothetical protein